MSENYYNYVTMLDYLYRYQILMLIPRLSIT